MKGIARITRGAGLVAIAAGTLFLGSCTGSDPIQSGTGAVRIQFTANSPITTGRFEFVGLSLNAVDLVNLDPLGNQIDPATYSLVATSAILNLTQGATATIVEGRVPIGRYRVTRVSIGSPTGSVMKDLDFTSPSPSAGVCLDHTGTLSGSVTYLAEPPVPDLIIDARAGAPADINISIDASAFVNAFLAGISCSNCPIDNDPNPPPRCNPTVAFNPTVANALLPTIVRFTE